MGKIFIADEKNNNKQRLNYSRSYNKQHTQPTGHVHKRFHETIQNTCNICYFEDSELKAVDTIGNFSKLLLA